VSGSPAAPAAARRAWIGAWLLVPVLVVAFHWRAARPGWAFAGSDLRYFFYGVREAVADALRRGELPWWQRGMFLGYPLVADPQAAILDPATWLTLPWDAPRALTLATLLHLCVAGWGLLAWLRLRGLGPAAALAGAVLFALGAKQTVHLIHWNFAATTAWWPWILAGLEGFARDGRGRWVMLAAVASGLAWLGGSPQMAYLGSLVAGAYAIWLLPALHRRRRADALLALVAVPAGLLLAAPAVLPTLELSRLGPRGATVTYAFAASWSWRDAWGYALLLDPASWHPRWGLNFWEATGYVGVPALALAAAAPLRRRGAVLFWLLALVGLLLPLGAAAPLGVHRFLYDWLPGYGSFRVPTRSLMVTAFAVSFLAAEGLQALLEDPTRARLARAATVLLGAAALVLVLPRLPRYPFTGGLASPGTRIVLGLAACGLAWLVAVWRGRRGPLAGAAALALVFADGWLLFSGFNEVAPARGEVPLLAPLVPLVPAAPAPRRVGVLAKWGQTANATLRQGWEGVTGYSPMAVQRVRELVEATASGEVRPMRPVTDDTNFPRPRLASPLWRLFAAPLVVSDEPQPLPVAGPAGREWENPLVAYRAEALPRVFWAGAWEVVPDDRVTAPLLAAAAGDRVVLADAPPGLGPTGAPEGPVAASEVRVGPRSLSATVVAPRDGLAVILDPFYPGWTATLDGRPAPVVRADFAFQAVAVPAGRHALELRYRNRWVGIGAAVSAASLALLAAALAGRRRTGAARKDRPGVEVAA
jgi:hypothetical protein